MDIEIIDQPIRFQLHGAWSTVENNRYAEVGLRLMDGMWRAVINAGLATTGINHWVYMNDPRMFVGVQVKDGQTSAIPAELRPLDFELKRYMKHLHIGPYQALPQKWQALRAELANRGEAIGFTSLEIYGHACADPAMAETTILIGLQKPAQ